MFARLITVYTTLFFNNFLGARRPSSTSSMENNTIGDPDLDDHEPQFHMDEPTALSSSTSSGVSDQCLIKAAAYNVEQCLTVSEQCLTVSDNNYVTESTNSTFYVPSTNSAAQVESTTNR